MAEAHSLLASLGVKPAQLLSGAYLDLLAAQAGEIGAHPSHVRRRYR